MRAPLLAALLLASLAFEGCSLTVDTDGLTGGAARDSGTPPVDACDPLECFSDTHVIARADAAACTGGDAVACRTQIAARCKALDPCCYKGGYGPLELPNATEMTVLCLADPTYTAPLSELTAADARCTASTLGSRACDVAAHLSAKKRGHGTAVIQGLVGDAVTLVGVQSENADVLDVSWSDLGALDAGCTAANVDQQACTTAVHRYCTSPPDYDTGTAGIGPVGWTATTVTVACLY